MGRERREEEERERRERREQKTKEREKRRALAEIQRETENVRTFSFTSHLPSSSLALLLFSSFFQFSHAHAQAKRNQSLTPPASRENNGRRPEQQPLGADCIELVDVGNAAVLHHQVVDALAPRRCRLSLLRVEAVSSRSSSHRHARDPNPRKGRRHPSLGLPLAHRIVRSFPSPALASALQRLSIELLEGADTGAVSPPGGGEAAFDPLRDGPARYLGYSNECGCVGFFLWFFF